MKQSKNGIPAVQTVGTWREAVNGYVMKPQSSRTRTIVMLTFGMLAAAAVDYRLFDQSLLRALTEFVR